MRRRANIYTAAAVETIVIFALALLICLAIDVLTSCRSHRDVVATEQVSNVADTARNVHSEVSTSSMQRVDSVVVRDSVFVRIKGDTVLIREVHWRDRLRESATDKAMAVVDTAWRTRTRDICRTVTVTVPRQLTAWQRFRIKAFWWLVGAVIAMGAAGWAIYRRRRA